jgi:uncharacterized iron-regulated protein
MTRIFLLALCFLCFHNTAEAQSKPAYVLFDAKGRKVSYEKMVKTLQGKDIVLFGEYHNNPIAHWLQLETIKDLHPLRPLALGAEMFEADNQEALTHYLDGQIDQKGLDTLARLWKNYPTDYAPLVNFAKDKKLHFTATNIPRKFASLVARGGFEALDTLSDTDKRWIAPLPMEYDANLPGYKAMLEMMNGHGGDNFPKAQASKDATMAHFILKNYRQGLLYIHFNGAYHSDNYEGILWYLRRSQPNLKYATISTITQADLQRLGSEHKNRADFIICVDEDMTTTY